MAKEQILGFSSLDAVVVNVNRKDVKEINVGANNDFDNGVESGIEIVLDDIEYIVDVEDGLETKTKAASNAKLTDDTWRPRSYEARGLFLP